MLLWVKVIVIVVVVGVVVDIIIIIIRWYYRKVYNVFICILVRVLLIRLICKYN